MSNTAALEASTRKTLVAQTSDQLFKKLQDGKLMGISKTIAIEILTKRKTDGKFDGDLTLVITNEKKKEVIAEKIEENPAVAKEKKKSAPSTGEKKEKGPSKLALKYPDFKLKFKKDDEVKFTPFRTTNELKGTVISSYPWQPKKGEVREDVRIRVGDQVYVKKGTEVTKVK